MDTATAPAHPLGGALTKPGIGRRVLRFIPWVLGALLVAAGVLAYLRHRARAKQPTIQYETAAVTRGPIQAKVTATGTLSALVTVQVGSQVSGRLQEILVDFNSPVKKGQLLARIDPRLFEDAVAQARANLAAARAALEKAQVQALDASRQLRRTSDLRQRNLVAQADLDTADTNARAARAQVDAAGATLQQAKATLHQAEGNLAYTRIVAPVDGVVISRNVDVGQTVAATFQSPTLFVLAQDLKKMQVDTSVAEADVGRLRAGMSATFTVDAYPSEKFIGTIRQIRDAPQTVQNVVTYDAVIDVENPEGKLKPGMTANTTVVYADRQDVLRLPAGALRFRPPASLAGRFSSPKTDATDRRTVWVLRDGQPQAVTVRVGVSDGAQAEVVQGELRPGDLAITEAVENAKSRPGSMGRIF